MAYSGAKNFPKKLQENARRSGFFGQLRESSETQVKRQFNPNTDFPETDDEARQLGYDSLEDYQREQHLSSIVNEGFEVGDLVIAKKKWPEKGIGKVVWTDGRNVHVRYDSKGRTVNYAPSSLDHVKIEGPEKIDEDHLSHQSEPTVTVIGEKDGKSETVIFDGRSEDLAKEEFLSRFPGYKITKCELDESFSHVDVRKALGEAHQGNKQVNSEALLKKLLPGIQSIYKAAYVRNGWEIVVPGRDLHHEDDCGVSIEYWDDEVEICVNHAKLPMDGVLATKMRIPKVRRPLKGEYNELDSITDADWKKLGEKTAKFIQSKDLFLKESVKESKKGSFFHRLRESVSQSDKDLFKKGFLSVCRDAVRDEEGEYLLGEDEFMFEFYPAEITVWKNDKEVGSVDFHGDYVQAGKETADFVKSLSINESATQWVPENPDEGNADLLFARADEYEQMMQDYAQVEAELNEEEDSPRLKIAKSIFSTLYSWATEPQQDPLTKKQLLDMYHNSVRACSDVKGWEEEAKKALDAIEKVTIGESVVSAKTLTPENIDEIVEAMKKAGVENPVPLKDGDGYKIGGKLGDQMIQILIGTNLDTFLVEGEVDTSDNFSGDWATTYRDEVKVEVDWNSIIQKAVLGTVRAK